jgi:predicted ester cyclase
MTPERNKAFLVNVFEVVVNNRDFSRLSEFFTPDFVRHDLGRLFPERFGTQGPKEHISMLLAGIPDLRSEIIDVFSEGDRVCVRYVATGTHTGELLGKPGTGKPLRWAGVNIYRIADDGRIAEVWQSADGVGLLQQIGVLPSAGGT